jgi:hypothetical protein
MGAIYWLSIIAQALLFVLTITRRGGREYRWFLIFLVASILTELSVFMFPHSGRFLPLSYTYTWMAVEPLLWGLRAAMVVEAWKALLLNYPGADELARRVFFVSLFGSAIVSVGLMPLEIPHVAKYQALATTLTLMIVAKRVLALTLALFVVAVAAVHLRYPVQIPRNLRIHAVMLALYLGWDASQCFLSSQHGPAWANEYALPAFFVMVTLWAFAYRRDGDVVVLVPFTAEQLQMMADGPAFKTFVVQLAWDLRRRLFW